MGISDKEVGYISEELNKVAGKSFDSDMLDKDKEIISGNIIAAQKILQNNPSDATLQMASILLESTKTSLEYGLIKEQEARTDKLTGLPNRLGFEKQMEIALKHDGTEIDETNNDNEISDKRHSGSKKYFAFIMLDVDRFKYLNDHYGHNTGDDALKNIGKNILNILSKIIPITKEPDIQDFPEILKNTIRKDKDNVFGKYGRSSRPGGDEFGLFIYTYADNREAAKEHLINGYTRIRDDLNGKYLTSHDKNFPLILSAGMHIFEKGDDDKTIYKKADDALAKDKGTKKLRYTNITDAMNRKGVEIEHLKESRPKHTILTVTEVIDLITSSQEVISDKKIDHNKLREAINMLVEGQELEKLGIEITQDDNLSPATDIGHQEPSA